MSPALEVAKHLIRLSAAGQEPDWLCHMRLQKLLYYAQGWSLAVRGRALFPEVVEAWQYGPVVGSLYPVFRRYGHGSIPPEDFNDPELDAEDAAFVTVVWDAYKEFSATKLCDMTHGEAPWLEARGGSASHHSGNAPISHEAMTAFFRTCEAPTSLAEIEAGTKLIGTRLDKARLAEAWADSPPPQSWYEEDTRCW